MTYERDVIGHYLAHIENTIDVAHSLTKIPKQEIIKRLVRRYGFVVKKEKIE